MVFWVLVFFEFLAFIAFFIQARETSRLIKEAEKRLEADKLALAAFEKKYGKKPGV